MRTRLVVTIAVAAVVLVPTPSRPVFAAAGDVSGVVTAASGGMPLEGIDVGLWGFDEGGAPTTLVAGATTGPDGSYTIEAAGECGYLLAMDASGAYARTEGGYTCGGQTVNVTMVAGGRLVGSITAATGGAAIPGACVRVAHAGGFVFGDTIACADGSGHYATVGLVPGFYRAEVTLPPGAAVLPSPIATPLAVGAGSTVVQDFELASGGRITGTVRDAISHAPLSGVQLWVGGQVVLSEADGTYATSALPPGDYSVFALPADAVHLSTSLADIEVAAVDVVDADLWLETGVTITGTVVDHLGAPVPGACLYEYWDEPDHSAEVCVDGAGAFTYGGLFDGGATEFAVYADGYDTEFFPVTAPGTVEFVLQPLQPVSGTITAAAGGAPVGVGAVTLRTSTGLFAGRAEVQPDGSFTLEVVAGEYVAQWDGPEDSPYADEYLDGAPTSEAATPFTVVAGSASPGHDFTLDLGGTINGVVTDMDGAPLAGAEVSAGGRSATTDANGVYSIGGLASGDHHVFASGPDVVPVYRTEGFDDAQEEWELIDVGVVLGQPTNGIDFALERMARITGRVLDDTTGLPLTGSDVALRSLDGFDETSRLLWDADGTFEFDVPAGSYHVWVGPTLGRLGEYGNGAHRFSDAEAVTVEVGELLDVGDIRLDDQSPSVFRALAAPARLVDTRPGQLGLIEQPAGSEGDDVVVPLAAGVVRRFVLTDVAGVPADPGALALNVTTALHPAKGWVTVYGCASAADPVPATSTVNFPADVNVANSAIVAPGAGGGVCVRASVATHLVIDLTGWFAGGFQPLAEPRRVADTRAGHLGAVEEPGWSPGADISVPLTPDEPLVLHYAGRDGIPGAQAMAVNLTVVNAAAAGYATVYPCWGAWDLPPPSSTLNFSAGATVANGTLVDPTFAHSICVVSNRAVDVIVDVTGYFEHGVSSPGPSRLIDTRPGQQGSSEETDIEVPVAAGSTLFVPANPYGWIGAALNVVAVNPSANGFLTVWSCSAPTDERPATSTVNFRAGVNVANGVLLEAGTGFCVYASATTHVIVDRAADTG